MRYDFLDSFSFILKYKLDDDVSRKNYNIKNIDETQIMDLNCNNRVVDSVKLNNSKNIDINRNYDDIKLVINKIESSKNKKQYN